MRQFYRYYIDKDLVKKDFKTLTAFCKEYGVNWKNLTYGASILNPFSNVPRKYIKERVPSKVKVFVKDKVKFVGSVEKSTHTLKIENGEVLLCQSH